ncbi:MAG: aldo/keto reductase [Sedimentisphaerales bacterium]|nr:aldo/keto reductase [Sedimentisphaerales bacterium]
MNNELNKVNRRNFLKTVGVAGLSSVIASKAKADSPVPSKVKGNEPNASAEKQQNETPQVPKRKFGKTGQDVSALSYGTIQLVDNQVLLISSLKWGVTYWDTASGYTNGNSEICIGKFLAAHPDVRKKVFIATKASGARSMDDVEDRLQTSLKRMNIDFVDVFYGVHVLNNMSQLTEEHKTWAENAKKRGLIKYFGFSTHSNMAQNLYEASKLGWVDAILTTYNFRLTKDAGMQKAIDACQKAGIALTAMKTQKSVNVETDEDKKLIEHFSAKGFTEGQAKIKAVFEDERIPAVTVGMNSVAQITENVAAVLDKTKLSLEDRMVLEQYAQATCSGYCAGCANICNAAVPDAPYISNVMRSLMYHNSYGDKQLARQAFEEIPADVRARLLTTDYRLAEQRCPQRMPIARLVRQAVEKLA